MKASDVVGRKIVSIRQERVYDEDQQEFVWSVTSLRLDNGSVIVPHVHETPGSYLIPMTVVKPK